MSSLINRTGSASFPRWIKGLIMGPPKSGKTTFLSTVPDIIIADTEPDANGLMSVQHLNLPYVEVDSTEKLQQLLFVLQDDSLRKQTAQNLGMNQVQGVGIDTLDSLQNMLKRERLKETRRTQFQRDDWGWLKDTMHEIVKAYTALPMHVFFTVHTKTTQDDDERIIHLPGLQGAMAEEIAGMVGYSMLTNRTREVRPDGTPYIAYNLRVQGDDKNPHLGNRAAGRLPDVIEPDFKHLLDAVNAAQAAAQKVAPPQSPPQPSTVQQAPPAEAPAPEPQPTQEKVNPAPEGVPPAQNLVTDMALPHIKAVFDEINVDFNESVVRTWEIDFARQIVKMWGAIKADAAAGKLDEEPRQAMIDYLLGVKALPFKQTSDSQGEDEQLDEQPEAATEEPQQGTEDAESAAESPEAVSEEQQNPAAAAELDITATIPKVLEWVGSDVERAQQAFDAEMAQSSQRSTLVNTLEQLGAKRPAPEVETPDTDGDEPPAMEQAVETVKQELGAVEVEGEAETDPAKQPCEECGMQPVDDPDIAVLARSRFQRHLCVGCYIAETKKARA